MIPTLAQQQELVNRKLATSKTEGNLIIFKYSRKVMYDNLWHSNPDTMECRGHVYDLETGELVQAAPRKSFNYTENGWWSDVKDDQPVIMYKKYNGYMLCATKHKGELVVSTTGSLSSDYANRGRQLLEAGHWTFSQSWVEEEITCLYEVLVPEDPHIVQEDKEGLVYLGFREKQHNGLFIPSATDARKAIECSFGRAKQIAEVDTGEGFMVYKIGNDGRVDLSSVCKLKTPYYVGKKKLMRMPAARVELMYNNPTVVNMSIPSMWWRVTHEIVKLIPKEAWLAFNDQGRRAVIEKMENLL